MKIYVDADAFPNAIKDIVFRAAERLKISLILVANQTVRIPDSHCISSIKVGNGPDVADDKIAELAQKGDLVITADIPLANRIVEKQAFALNHRGELYTDENIKERLATRDLMDQLRSAGIDTGGPPPLTQKDRKAFADQFDRFLTRHRAADKS